MKIFKLLPALSILLFSKPVMAQSFEGVWKGTSLCQVKNSPCHDEVVVYYISKDSTGKGYEINANKIVNGKEESMGILIFTYDEQKKVYVSLDKNVRWEFKMTGNIMKGTLMVKGALYRLIDLKKDN